MIQIQQIYCRAGGTESLDEWVDVARLYYSKLSFFKKKYIYFESMTP